MRAHPGLIAALDQSGGSAPEALRHYGIKKGAWSNEDEVLAIVHQMRTRIITSPSFASERIIGAILFEKTMDRNIERRPTADYLWNVKRVVPFLKVDQGLAAERDAVQLMKPIPTLLDKAKAKGIFGTKMPSLIEQANAASVNKESARPAKCSNPWTVMAGILAPPPFPTKLMVLAAGFLRMSRLRFCMAMAVLISCSHVRKERGSNPEGTLRGHLPGAGPLYRTARLHRPVDPAAQRWQV
jgi:hypothetical protein